MLAALFAEMPFIPASPERHITILIAPRGRTTHETRRRS